MKPDRSTPNSSRREISHFGVLVGQHHKTIADLQFGMADLAARSIHAHTQLRAEDPLVAADGGAFHREDAEVAVLGGGSGGLDRDSRGPVGVGMALSKRSWISAARLRALADGFRGFLAFRGIEASYTGRGATCPGGS